MLGMMHETGILCYNNERAKECYRKAAEHGDVESMYRLAKLIQETDRSSSSKSAMEWYLKAAESGHHESQLALGMTLMVEPQQNTEVLKWAKYWISEAAASGLPEALYQLAQMYLTGIGTETSDEEAFRLFLESAEAGDADGMYMVAKMYEIGRYVECDPRKAMEWYLKAAEIGNEAAMFNIGLLYENGIGVEANRAEAISWFILAHHMGKPEAKRALTRLGEVI